MVRAIHVSEHHTRPGDPLLKPADVNLDPSARSAHVQKGKETNWSNTQDTALVAAWGPHHRCGHLQRFVDPPDRVDSLALG